jgi:membrane-associated phospholipid phosphatase
MQRRNILLLIFCLVVGVVAVLLNFFYKEVDIALLRPVNLNRYRPLDMFFIFITNSVTYVAIGTLVILVVWFREQLVRVVLAFAASAAVATVLKYGLLKPRPFVAYNFIEKLTGGGSPSFPSGHTTDAFFLAGAVSLLFNKWYVYLGMYVWAVLVGYSRMCLGVHYPSDVLMGVAIGSSVALIQKG